MANTFPNDGSNSRNPDLLAHTGDHNQKGRFCGFLIGWMGIIRLCDMVFPKK